MLKIRKAYKYRLKTNVLIESKLSQYCGSARFVWNKCLAMNLDRLEKRQPILWYNEQAFWLTVWKQSEEYGFLKDLERAFKDCFDKSQPLKRTPVFKKRGLNDGICFHPSGADD